MNTGGLVDGLYRASYNRRPQYAEFMPDTAVVARNVVVGETGWPETLNSNKQAFVEAWVQRAEFQTAYGGLNNAAYVDSLISHAGGFNGDREALVSGLNQNTLSRATVLRQIAENDGFAQREAKRHVCNDAVLRLPAEGSRRVRLQLLVSEVEPARREL